MSADLAQQVIACAEQTLAAPVAQIEVRHEWRHIRPQAPRATSRRRSGLAGPTGKLAKRAIKAAGKAAWRHWDPGQLDGEGIIEPPLRRHMIDFGSYAEIYTDGRRFGGRSGRPLATLDLWSSDSHVDLWWLLDALSGTAEAIVEGEETLRGTTCRRLAAKIDLERASAATERSLHVPEVEGFGALRALPFTVWIDADHIRRVRFQEASSVAQRVLTVELWDIGALLGDLEWERLPTFRSPEEAAHVSGEREPSRLERVIGRILGGRSRT